MCFWSISSYTLYSYQAGGSSPVLKVHFRLIISQRSEHRFKLGRCVALLNTFKYSSETTMPNNPYCTQRHSTTVVQQSITYRSGGLTRCLFHPLNSREVSPHINRLTWGRVGSLSTRSGSSTPNRPSSSFGWLTMISLIWFVDSVGISMVEPPFKMGYPSFIAMDTPMMLLVFVCCPQWWTMIDPHELKLVIDQWWIYPSGDGFYFDCVS